MSVLTNNERIGAYNVQSVIKANHYTETYRVVDSNNNPFFLKLFIVNKMPQKLLNPETHVVKEIEYCKLLNHRNIVSHVADGRFERESGAYQWYVTDYFKGDVLADRLARKGAMSEEEALRIFRSLLAALQYMHAKAPAICHNDITPANIVLCDAMDGEAVLIDLGHASTPCAGVVEFDTDDLDVTYHAKETMVGIFDQVSDIFSACAVFYTMLTGRAPWVIDVPASGNYKERFKAMWQYRETHKLDLSGLSFSDKTMAILEQGLALKASDRIPCVDNIIDVLDDREPRDDEPRGPKLSDGGKVNDREDGGNGGNGNQGGKDVDVKELLKRAEKAVQGDDWLHTDGRRILDKDGKEVWLTGLNWFGYNTGTNLFDGLWNSKLEPTVKAIADHGFNLIRVPISAELINQWAKGEYPTANYNHAYNPQLNSMNSLEIFEYFLKLAEANGIKVMPDIHSAETTASSISAPLKPSLASTSGSRS